MNISSTHLKHLNTINIRCLHVYQLASNFECKEKCIYRELNTLPGAHLRLVVCKCATKDYQVNTIFN